MLSNGTDSERLPFVLKKLEQVEAAYIKLESQLAELKEENAELRADLVWALSRSAFGTLYDKAIWFYDQSGRRRVDCDNTPESICRAVREARDGVS